MSYCAKMSVMRFDGKAFASEMEEKLTERVGGLGRKLRAVSIVVGDDPASIKYSELKQAAAERVGIDFEVRKLKDVEELKRELANLGEDVDGVMVQLPVPGLPAQSGLQGETLKGVLSAIPLKKDMDGMRWEESGVTPATVRAILSILDKIAENSKLEIRNSKIVVVGAKGAVGRPLVIKLKERGVEVIDLDLGDNLERVREGQVVVSCTGRAGLITPEMVQEGAVVVDVGAPVGDMTKEVYDKASVYVPSRGGVGPVTISCLLLNLYELNDRKITMSIGKVL